MVCGFLTNNLLIIFACSDGTPILDIKPYVPDYDSVDLNVSLPNWVSTGLKQRRNVVFTAHAESQLLELVTKGALEFYKSDEIKIVKSAVEEILSVDVRSSYLTNKGRKGRFQAELSLKNIEVKKNGLIENEDSLCSQQIDNLMIYYDVKACEDLGLPSTGSGCHDRVKIHKICLITKKSPEILPCLSNTIPESASTQNHLKSMSENNQNDLPGVWKQKFADLEKKSKAFEQYKLRMENKLVVAATEHEKEMKHKLEIAEKNSEMEISVLSARHKRELKEKQNEFEYIFAVVLLYKMSLTSWYIDAANSWHNFSSGS